MNRRVRARVVEDHVCSIARTLRAIEVGSCIHVHVRPYGLEASLLFFDGRKSLTELRHLHRLIGAAIKVMAS